ncbi:MAG: alcohol acetyltransferase [Eubacteriales bacterium]|nr:alcohol acetyltransferase [Eubacteriales bacterium]
MKENEPTKWYRLDNAAKLYPAIKSRKWTAVFRVSVKMLETVDRDLLSQALDATVGRMGIFSCRLRAGLFWYYFEKNKKRARVMEDAINPCIRLYTKESGGYLFRVRAHDKRISLEVFHSVSDGYGATTFLKTLVAEYLKLKGYDIPATHGVLDCSEPPKEEETEDGFLRYYNKKSVKAWKETLAYQIKGTKEKGHTLNIVNGIISVKDIKAVAKKYDVSLTDFLVGVYIQALYTIQKNDAPKKILPIKVSVPVNLRAFFDTRTMRNFSSYVNPEINANWGDYTFEEILYVVHHYLRHTLTKKQLTAKMSKNVKAEKSIFVRIMPLFIKNIIINAIFHIAGESRITGTLTNLGIIDMPDEMAAHIERFDAMLGALRYNKVSCAVCAFGDILNICFTSTIKEADVEREFFTFLVKMGLHVKLETNREV